MENISLKAIPTREKSEMHVEDVWAREQIRDLYLKVIQKFEQTDAEVRDIKEDVRELHENVKENEWKVQTVQSIHASHTIDIPLSIRTTFGKLEEDFSNFSNRIVWCDELKNSLSRFEGELEEYDAKYLSWFVSALKDVFTYNYAETITKEQLDLLKNGIEIIYKKQGDCDKDSFAEYHLQLVESGLSLLPTTQKAIEEFGE